jgi:hypothetical protein
MFKESLADGASVPEKASSVESATDEDADEDADTDADADAVLTGWWGNLIKVIL